MTGGDAIGEYHDLLTDELAAESQEQLDRQLDERGLHFGDRPLCTVLRPRFLTAAQYALLQARAGLVLSAFTKAYRRALADESLLAQFRLEPWERELLAQDPGFRDPSPVSRLDAFFEAGDDGRGLRFTEYNAETPAGSAYNDVLSEVFYGLPVTRDFLRRWDMRPLPARHNVLHALLDSWRQWSGTRDRPRIGILDWDEVPTRSEFLLFQDYYRRQGIDCVIVDPRELEYRDGSLRDGSGRIDLLYKRVLITELVEREGMEGAVMRAVRDRAVCMVNPFRCKILHKKASLAVLSDERNAELYAPEERRAIQSHIPWTRVVEERRTLHEGREIDLVPFIAEHRERLVIKPNDEYGGKGIVLGWEVDDAAWAASLETAMLEPAIVQERVALPSEPYPSVVEGRVVLADRMMDTAPYVAYGQYVDGCLSRLSTATLLNVSAGGGSTVPTFVVERRI